MNDYDDYPDRVALVLLPAEQVYRLARQGFEALREAVYDMIRPYEASPWPPTLIPCQCVPSREAGFHAADKQVGTLVALWYRYLKLPKEERPHLLDFVPYVQWQHTAILSARAHPKYDVDPDCPHCQGSGVVETHKNLGTPKFFRARVLLSREDDDIDLDPGGVHYTVAQIVHNNDDWELDLNIEEVWSTDDVPDDLEFDAIITPDGVWHNIDVSKGGATTLRELARSILRQYPDCLTLTVYLYDEEDDL